MISIRFQRKAGGPIGPPAVRSSLLLAFVGLDHVVDLLFHRIQVKGSRVLHRRVIDGRHRELRDFLLHEHEPPELAGIEIVHVTTAHVVEALSAGGWRALERILADVHHAGHIGHDLGPGPALRLRKELELEIIEANGAQLRAAEVPKLVALGWAFAGEQVRLVVAIEMILVLPIAKLHAFEQLIGDVRIAGRGAERGEPIEAGEDAVLDACPA